MKKVAYYDPPKRTLSKSNSIWFARFFSTVDTEIAPNEWVSPNDDKETIEQKRAVIDAKRRKQLIRMVDVKSTINSPGFRYLEDMLMSRVHNIDTRDIWELDRRDNKNPTGIKELEYCFSKLSGERDAIISIFSAFANLDIYIETLSKATELSSENNNDVLASNWQEYLETYEGPTLS